jgi:hypothetical protein
MIEMNIINHPICNIYENLVAHRLNFSYIINSVNEEKIVI